MTANSCLDITNTTFCMPLEESKDSLRLKQDQRKLLLLFHAATCNETDAVSCNVAHCVASKRLFQHILICTDPSTSSHQQYSTCGDCPVPGCKRSRSIWRHYRKCAIEDCRLCSVAPARPQLLVQRSPPKKKMDRPPLSPRKTTDLGYL